jgi:hypothetical protein
MRVARWREPARMHGARVAHLVSGPHAPSEQLRLTVVEPDGLNDRATLDPVAQVRSLVQQAGYDPAAVRLLADGERLREGASLSECGLKNDDVIVLVREQMGGGGNLNDATQAQLLATGIDQGLATGIIEELRRNGDF